MAAASIPGVLPFHHVEHFPKFAFRNPLFLDEEGSLLTLEIDNIYETRHGEFSLNGPNPDFQTGSYTFEGQTYLVRRHQEEENDLLTELASMGFQARSNKLWFLEPEEAIAFLLDQYPALVEKYRVYGERALSRYKMRTTKSTISAEVVSNEKEKWFSLEISVDYDGQSLPLEKIWKAWKICAPFSKKSCKMVRMLLPKTAVWCILPVQSM